MKNKIPALLLSGAFLLLCCSPLAEESHTPTEGIIKAIPSIIRIEHSKGMDTGFFINQNTLVTVFQVVEAMAQEGKSSIKLFNFEGDLIKVRVDRITIKQLSLKYNLAILEIKINLPAPQLLKQINQNIHFGLLPSVSTSTIINSEGIAYAISYSRGQKTPDVSIGHALHYFEETSPITINTIDYIPFNRFPKDSGSFPLLNTDGEVIGFYTSLYVPVSYLRQIIHQEPLPQHRIKRLIKQSEKESLTKQKSPEEKKKIMTKLAEQGFSMAQYNLAKIFLENSKTALDTETGLQWMREATENNFAPAQYEIGMTSKDPKVKLEWFQKSALQNFTMAQYELGKMFLEGHGTDKDIKKGLQLISEAIKRGFIPREHDLYLYREDTEEDRNLSIKILSDLIRDEISKIKYEIHHIKKHFNPLNPITERQRGFNGWFNHIMAIYREEQKSPYKDRLQKIKEKQTQHEERLQNIQEQYKQAQTLMKENKMKEAFLLLKQITEDILERRKNENTWGILNSKGRTQEKVKNVPATISSCSSSFSHVNN